MKKESDPVFLFFFWSAAHIAGIDSFTPGLKAAVKLIEEGTIDDLLRSRYASYRDGIGKEIVDGSANYKKLEEYIIDRETIQSESANQEFLERLINWAIVKASD